MRLTPRLKKAVLALAATTTDKHVVSWHRGFKDGQAVYRGSTFGQCTCLVGELRNEVMRQECR